MYVDHVRERRSEHLELKFTTGCAGSPVKEITHQLAPAELEEVYSELAASDGGMDAGHRSANRIVGAHGDTGKVGAYEEG